MDFSQGRIATLHDYGDAHPDVPATRTAVVVPLSARDAGSLTADRLFESLAGRGFGSVVVPLRAPPERVGAIVGWLDSFAAPIRPIWCNGPELRSVLETHGLDGNAGKGRDVWLGLGLAADADYVVLHDADVNSYEPRDLAKLIGPLVGEASFVKAYYARVEDERLYGRLFRLLYTPLVSAVRRDRNEPIVDYLGAFRYALAGEFAMTGDLARSMRIPRRWGLEVGTLGEAFRTVGFRGSAQVDLGRYEHGHRAVDGPTGLSSMAEGVVQGVLRVLADAGVHPSTDSLRDRYGGEADRYIERYRADARFNGFAYDESAEREQVRAYADAIDAPGPDNRLPAWNATSLDRSELHSAIRTDLDRGE